MQKLCYYNGKIIPAEDVRVPITDIGFLRGFGIFDYIKVYDGVPFLLDEHIARLVRSAKIMGLVVPLKEKEIKSIVGKLLSKYTARFAAIRMILTGGPAHGLSYDSAKETFIIAVEDVAPMDEKYYTRGGSLMTFEHERLFPEVKTLNYITAVKLQKEREKKKAVEILFTSKGKILEATTSNFFIFKNNKLVTPKKSILIGCTRNHVLSCAKKAGFTIQERDIMLKELGDAHEACITASNKEVLPIVAIDGKKIGNGKVGPRVQTLMNVFQDSINHYVKYYQNKRS